MAKGCSPINGAPGPAVVETGRSRAEAEHPVPLRLTGRRLLRRSRRFAVAVAVYLVFTLTTACASGAASRADADPAAVDESGDDPAAVDASRAGDDPAAVDESGDDPAAVDASRDDADPAAGSELASAPADAAEPAAGSADGSELIAVLMAGPGGVIELADRLEEALSAATEALATCDDSGACLSRYEQDPAPSEEALDLLDAYAGRVREVSDAVSALPGASADAAALAQQWLSAATLTVNAAASMLGCLDASDPEDHPTWLPRCSAAGEMYAASLIEHNRLRADFESAYLAHAQPESATP